MARVRYYLPIEDVHRRPKAETTNLPEKSMNLFWANPISNHPKAIIGADIKIMVFLPYFPDRIPPVVHVNTPIISVTPGVEFSS